MERKKQKRILFEYKGDDNGPLLVKVISAIHGNEVAGIKALELVRKMLEVESITNPSFRFRGKMIGLIGNLQGVERGTRYIDEDLNRMWRTDKVEKIKSTFPDSLNTEELELYDILSTIHKQIELENPSELFILDLHTTSSGGGIFTIPTEDPLSQSIAKNLHAPVILNMIGSIRGTTLHYFNDENFPIGKTCAVAFEGGQHQDELSVNRCIAAIVNFLRSINCVEEKDVENIHDQILLDYSANLPTVSSLLYRHNIISGDGFRMNPGFNNFDPIKKGELLAFDNQGPITSKRDGLILMPLYQDQGSEGFFVIRPSNDFNHSIGSQIKESDQT